MHFVPNCKLHLYVMCTASFVAYPLSLSRSSPLFQFFFYFVSFSYYCFSSHCFQSYLPIFSSKVTFHICHILFSPTQVHYLFISAILIYFQKVTHSRFVMSPCFFLWFSMRLYFVSLVSFRITLRFRKCTCVCREWNSPRNRSGDMGVPLVFYTVTQMPYVHRFYFGILGLIQYTFVHNSISVKYRVRDYFPLFIHILFQ